MKVNVKIILENKSISLDIDETQFIESLSDLINSQLSSIDNYYFIYNKVICETGKTLAELEFIDDCVVYAAKKSDKPLKRKIENEDLSNLLTYGSFPKKSCVINGDNVHEHTVWQNKGLSEVQADLHEMLLNNPFQFEPLILQSPVEEMIRNPSIINSLYSTNPVLNEIIEKKPEQVKFFSDLSQYDWIQNVISDSSEMERIGLHYSQNFKNVIDSKRFKRMHEILEKVDGSKPGECETLEIPDYDEKSLDVFTKSQYAQNLADLLAQDKELSEKVLKSCPYGANMSAEKITDIQNILPEALNNFKKALSQQSNGGESMYSYLAAHPLQVDEETALRLEEMTGLLPETKPSPGDTDSSQMYTMLHKVHSWVSATPTQTADSIGGVPSLVGRNYNKELELLNEMGFCDNGVNVKVLAREYGSVNRAAITLATL